MLVIKPRQEYNRFVGSFVFDELVKTHSSASFDQRRVETYAWVNINSFLLLGEQIKCKEL